MRIIGGEARARRLFAPEGDETRPTSDKVREALFNIIRGDVWGANVLDLFAGSGALGLEAISRGAESAVFCDVSKKAVAAAEKYDMSWHYWGFTRVGGFEAYDRAENRWYPGILNALFQ